MTATQTELGAGSQDAAAVGGDPLYREDILEHYKHPLHKGHLELPDVRAREVNPTCGDWIAIELSFTDDGHVSEVAFDGAGCAISQAAASMLCDELTGKTTRQLLALGLHDVLRVLGIDLSATRMKCATLPLKVIKLAALQHEQGAPITAPGDLTSGHVQPASRRPARPVAT